MDLLDHQGLLVLLAFQVQLEAPDLLETREHQVLLDFLAQMAS